jgi:hypothetical protein
LTNRHVNRQTFSALFQSLMILATSFWALILDWLDGHLDCIDERQIARVHRISGIGMVAVGRVLAGTLKVGESAT